MYVVCAHIYIYIFFWGETETNIQCTYIISICITSTTYMYLYTCIRTLKMNINTRQNSFSSQALKIQPKHNTVCYNWALGSLARALHLGLQPKHVSQCVWVWGHETHKTYQDPAPVSMTTNAPHIVHPKSPSAYTQ